MSGKVRVSTAAAIAGVALAVLAAPASADVDNFTVDSFVDAGDINIGNNLCQTGGAVCTLRAAVQETNDNDGPGEIDTIGFAAPIVGTTIQLGSVLDTIDEPVSINGCSTAPNNPAPCVGVRGLNTSTDAFFLTGATDVTFRGLAITNVDRGIAALSGTDDLTVRNNWFGITVGGADEAIRQGVNVSADGAVIGGTAGATGSSPADRNVFANATVGEAMGLNVFVGDNAIVRGNWFGLDEAGTAAAPNGDDIVVGGSPSDTATGTSIGGAQDTPGVCDEACNVISGATGDAVDLRGTHSQDASGTIIRGNFVGLNAAGNAAIPNATGIRVVNAPQTTIGGATAGQGNYIAGGGTGIAALFQGAPDLLVQGNFIGTNTAGTAPLGAPTGIGITVMSDATDPSTITGNTIATAAAASDAIQAHGTGVQIGGNRLGIGTGEQQLGAGGIGIRGVNLAGGSILTNRIGNFTLYGLTLEGSTGVTVRGNFVGTDASNGDHGNGTDGIRITDLGGVPSTGNTIGGTLLAHENVISNNGDDAIRIAGDGNDGNLIQRNRGTPNGSDLEDLFVDLGGTDGEGNGATGPNAGVEAPRLVAGTGAKTIGLAGAGATVDTYITTDNQFSSLVGYAGSAVADSRGLWTATHTATPGAGQGIGATQVPAGGTSEVASISGASFEPGDVTPPGAALLGGPGVVTPDNTPSFTLDDPTSDPNFEEFLCAVDSGLWLECGVDGDTFTTGTLADGSHSVHLMGADEGANLSAIATTSFAVDTTAPSTTVTKAPKSKVTVKKKKVKVSFSFASSEAGGGFQCQLDSAEFVLCDSGSFSAKVKKGSHTFRVRAYDAAGNPDPTLEVRSFKATKKKKKKKKK